MRLIDADALFESLMFPSEQWKASFKQLLDDEPTAYPNERIKDLIDASGMSIEEMLAESANYNLDCAKCVLSEKCAKLDLTVCKKTGLFYGCTDIWEEYLKGEADE